MRSFLMPILASFCLASGCLVDADAPCGAGFVLTENDTCECAAGSVYDPTSNGCLPCQQNEHVQGDACVCDEGYTRQGNTCVQGPPGWGDLCSTTGVPPCPGVLECHADSGNSGYCTLLDCNAGDCFGGYVCDDSGATAFCKAPPRGQGRSCSTAADCASTEATYCDSFMSGVCLVEGCTQTPDSCFPGWRCCDFTIVGGPTLCINEETCPF